MANGIPKEVKDEILLAIKSGTPVSKVSEQHGVSTKTVYRWLKNTITEPVSLREMQKLRKENRELKEIIGALTVENAKIKKKTGSY